MPRPPITLGGLTYPNRSVARAHLRAMLRHPDGCDYTTYPVRLARADAAVVIDAIAHHPEASGRLARKAVAVEVRLNLPYMVPGMWLVFEDGSSASFSVKAIFTITGPSKRQLVLKAMRAEIEDQVRAIRHATRWPARCPVTGDSIGARDAHVDHAHPATFAALADGWLAAQSLSVDSIDLDKDPRSPTVMILSDRNLAASWSAYHANHARLRIVSARANLSMGDRGAMREEVAQGLR